MTRRSLITIAVLLGWTLVLAGACRKTGPGQTTAEKELQAAYDEAEAASAAAEAEAAKPKPAPPKVNEDVYVDIAARLALIRQKFAEDAEAGEKEIEALYEKLAVTSGEIKEYEVKIGPAGVAALQRKVQERIQKIENEYR
jgi:hypothetical protein